MSHALTRILSAIGVSLLLVACGQSEPPAESSTDAAPAPAEAAPAPASPPAAPSPLDLILAAQPEEAQARYQYRHPKETLEFFGIEPGMNVLEALPGGGWYSKILIPYLGVDGTLVGVDYAQELFPLFGFFTEEQLQEKETWVEDWTEDARGWVTEGAADIEAFQFGSMPANLEGEMDAVLFIRALHNLARFESEGQFLTTALDETMRILKPGGIVGVVQHMAPADASDDWASGANGYLKKDFVVSTLQGAGFELVGESDINLNPQDQPTEDDFVWRLSPTLATSRDNEELRASLTALGESNRMTLLFRKPE